MGTWGLASSLGGRGTRPSHRCAHGRKLAWGEEQSWSRLKVFAELTEEAFRRAFDHAGFLDVKNNIKQLDMKGRLLLGHGLAFLGWVLSTSPP